MQNTEANIYNEEQRQRFGYDSDPEANLVLLWCDRSVLGRRAIHDRLLGFYRQRFPLNL